MTKCRRFTGRRFVSRVILGDDRAAVVAPRRRGLMYTHILAYYIHIIWVPIVSTRIYFYIYLLYYNNTNIPTDYNR